MADSTPIMSKLKVHPITTKENLLTLCKEFAIETDSGDTRATMQAKIAELCQLNSDDDQNVRERIAQMSKIYRDKLHSRTNGTPTGDGPQPHTQTNGTPAGNGQHLHTQTSPQGQTTNKDTNENMESNPEPLTQPPLELVKKNRSNILGR